MRSVTELPLHGGHAPKWLFKRMVKLGRSIGLVIIDDFGPDELIVRLSDSNWFQALSCALGYDWHSSGTTTVTLGALKEALNDTGEIFIAGGKGKAGLKTPEDIEKGSDFLSIPNASQEFTNYSKISAKVDSSLVYENIGIYHHSFLFTKNKKWAVVQQALDAENRKAIRFQWHSDFVDKKEIANEPHTSVNSRVSKISLDLTSSLNRWAREESVEVLEEYERTVEHISYPARHKVMPDIDVGKRGLETIRRASELSPQNYQELLLIKGMGRKVLRSLALISSLIYDKELAYRDPVTYSYNLGGKDGTPFRINTSTYDDVIRGMKEIVDKANMEREERYSLLKKLDRVLSNRQAHSL